MNARMGASDETALHVAARLNKVAFIPALMEAGASVEARNIVGGTPLYLSASHDSRGALLTLLRLGANVDTQADGGVTPLPAACAYGLATIADRLLRWGGDETVVNLWGKTPGHITPALEDNRPELERLTMLLAYAPQDRAWRRCGFIVMCCALPDRLRLVVETPDAEAEAIGQQPQQLSSHEGRRREVEAAVAVGAHKGGAGIGKVRERKAGGDSSSDCGGFDGVAAWLMAVNDGDVFSAIVGFL